MIGHSITSPKLIVHYYNGFEYHFHNTTWWRVAAWKSNHLADESFPHVASPLMQQLLSKFVENHKNN